MSLWRMLRLTAQMVKANVMLTMEYRIGYFIAMVNIVLRPAIALLVWLTVAQHGVRLPYDREQFVTYFVLMGIASLATQTWTSEYVAADIRNGDLNKVLVRPAPHILHYIANNLGEKVIKLGLLLLPIALMILAFRDQIQLPSDPLRWALFVLALTLAAVLAFLLDYLMGSFAFFLQDVGGAVGVERLLYALLAGRFVPLALFPASLSGFLEAQPFRYLLSFPLEVLTASLTPPALARGFAWQVTYCVGFVAAYRLLWRYGLRSYAAASA
jgi:ABC-2 type transport system permease protein